ncbi:MAG: PIG-L family deacetylase [Acidobacteria bacterium]|nr:MAG: PIG-L family deacetylase [Acidobacteriota bacterium]
MDVSTNLPIPTTALLVAAHPDDADFGAAGTAAKWARAGAAVTYLVVTDGSKGSWDPAVVPARLAVRREEEQARACEMAGARPPEFLRLRDGSVENTMDLRRELAAWIRRLAPQVVITHDPWKPYMLHPDHRSVGTAVCDAVVAARDPHFYPEQISRGIGHHRPEKILLWSASVDDHVEELSEADVETKLLALRCHESQFESTMRHTGTSTSEAREFEDQIRARCRSAGEIAGFQYGEAFKALNADR